MVNWEQVINEMELPEPESNPYAVTKTVLPDGRIRFETEGKSIECIDEVPTPDADWTKLRRMSGLDNDML